MELKKKVRLVQIIGAASDALTKLEDNINMMRAKGKTPAKEDTQLLRSIERNLDLLKQNPFRGDNVQKEKWPKEFSNLPNLFRIELAGFWRLLYYVTGDEVKVVSVVFEICDHSEYDRIFGYKKR